MRVNPYLTPAQAGLIMIAVVVFGVIFVRIITMSEQSEVRVDADTAPEKDSRITLDIGGVKGLRGSLP